MPPAAPPLASGPPGGPRPGVVEHAGDHLRREVGQVDEGDEDGLGHSAALVGRRGETGEACSQRGTDALVPVGAVGDVDVAAERPYEHLDLITGRPHDDGGAVAPSGSEQVDGPLDEGGLVGGDAQQCLGATHPAAGARREHEPAHVWHASVPKGAGVEGVRRRVRRGHACDATAPAGMPRGEEISRPAPRDRGVCLVDSRRRKWFASGSRGWRQLLRAHRHQGHRWPRPRRDRKLAVFAASRTRGCLRLGAPQPVAAWDGVREALRFGPPPPQSGAFGMDALGEQGEEGDDWLTVNVWSRDLHGRLPVMVWIQGGAYTFGMSGLPEYDGSTLAHGGVVVVTFNYRVGLEGFGYVEGLPVNRGLLDQVAALEWVQDNIGAFGGDPGRVTYSASPPVRIGGGPAGDATAAGLFHRAIAQSVAGKPSSHPDWPLTSRARAPQSLGLEPAEPGHGGSPAAACRW